MNTPEKHESTEARRIAYLHHRIRELNTLNEMMCQQLRKVELRLKVAVSVAVGATAGLVTSLLI